jgi:hypothetical protein
VSGNLKLDNIPDLMALAEIFYRFQILHEPRDPYIQAAEHTTVLEAPTNNTLE